MAEEELKRILAEAEEAVNHGRKRKGRMASPHSVAQGEVLALLAVSVGTGGLCFNRTHTASSTHTNTEAAVSS